MDSGMITYICVNSWRMSISRVSIFILRHL